MKKYPLLLIAMLLCFSTAFADENGDAKKTKNLSRDDQRELSSMEETLSLHPQRSVQRDWYLRFTAAGGYSTVNSNNSAEIAARGASGYNQNGMGDLSVEGQYGRYMGGELEGFYGMGASQSAQTVDKITGLIDSRQRSISQRGAMMDIQVRYPMSHFKRDWGWHAGVGYGLTGVLETAPASQASTVDQSQLNLHGPYATLGVEVRIVRDLSFMTDYAHSIFAGGDRSNITAGTAANSSYDSAHFDRFRIQLAYILTPDYRVGLMFTRRTYVGTTNGVGDDSEATNQFLATLQFIL